MIQFERITKKYGNAPVLSGISFRIEKGELAVLIGPSGCGKTTLLKIINRLIKPSSGNVLIDGKSIFDKDEIELRRNIGYVIQQTGLFPHMTIRQNIEIIPRLQRKNKREIAQKSIQLMEMIGLEPGLYLDRYPSQLSGGQQQRIGVARAFACDPEVILMDEPFSALDPPTRLQLQEELAQLQASVRKTIVFVTHDMDEAVKIADRICILNAGGVVQYDTVEEIMKNPANDFVAAFIGKNRIWSSPEYIKAKDIMIHHPVCAPPESAVLRCMYKMSQAKVDSLLITDRHRQLLGIAYAKDLRELDDKNVPVSNAMLTDYESVSPDTNIVDILQSVSRSDRSSFPVLDEGKKLHGLVTKSSLLTAVSQQYINGEEEKHR
ncbi:MAG: ABC transporter ATP-binding protein [Treponema sp.]|nr:ABC transporter ATP-binding protein [Treponema sp.]